MSRIGIDATALSREGKGVSRYLREYLWALQDFPLNHDFFIFVKNNGSLPELPENPRFHYIETRDATSLLWEQWTAPRFMRRLDLHLFHTPLDRLPLFPEIPAIMYLFETPDRRHQMLKHRERSVYGAVSRKLIQAFFPRSLKKAALIMVSSQNTRRDLRTRYHVPPDKIELVYPAANALFRPAGPEEKNRIRTQAGLQEGYVLHFSSEDPRDNTAVAMAAYAGACRRSSREIPPLVIAGSLGRFQESVIRQAGKLGISDRVKFAGYQSGKKLVELYQGARVYFDPSLFEGFGFQVAEALACGIPVVTSNESSLPELTGDAALTAPPRDAGAFSDALVKVLSDRDLARRMEEKSLRESKKFSWKRLAEQTLNLYDKVLQESGR